MQNTIIASKLRGGGGTDSPNYAPDKSFSWSVLWNKKCSAFFKAFSITDTFRRFKICHSEFRHSRGCCNYAFTLAEVLITLGIIGIVAAMTLPALIQKNNNQVVEARLKKFYSVMNQAIIQAEADYGDKKDWFEDLSMVDEEGNIDSSKVEDWFNKYFAPYLKIIKTEKFADGTFIVYFPDGSALELLLNTSTRDWDFYPGNIQKCKQKEKNNETDQGICRFTFLFNPARKSNSGLSSWTYHLNKGLEPFKTDWDGDIQKLYTHSQFGCNASAGRYYCTAIIQMNGWKIPDNYPFKVSY